MKQRLDCVLLIGMACLPIGVQQAAATQPAMPPATTIQDAHQSAIEFVEALGMRQLMVGQLDKLVQDGKDAMVKNDPSLNPAFVDEWGKRMKARFNADDYIAVVVHVYETHFTNSELQQLIQAQRDLKASKPPNVSPELKQKLTTEGVAIQSEIIGGCTQVGAKLGGEVAQEILKEHPEWSSAPKPAPAKQ
jgi:hypothetical protein